MKLKAHGFGPNGRGDLIGTIIVLSDEGIPLGFEDTGNFSDRKRRQQFVQYCAEETGEEEGVVRAKLAQALKRLREAAPESSPASAVQEKGADALVRIIKQADVLLFHDQVGEPYAVLEEGARRVVFSLGGKDFQQWAARLGYEQLGGVPSTESGNSALKVLEGQAKFAGPEHRLGIRTTWHEGRLYYDLGDWRAVRIGPTGWEIDPKPPTLFRRFSHQKPQVEPEPGGDLHRMLDLVNLPERDQRLLYLCSLIAGLVPDIPRATIIVHGPHGSAKSHLHLFYAELLDPSEIPLLSTPRDLNEFTQNVAHRMVCFFDNISLLPHWLGDALARYATGYGFSKRRLWTDDDDFVLKARGIGGLNSINQVVTQADLLDRALVFQVPWVTDDHRIEEKELHKRFEDLRPSLLGAIFTALSRSMSTLQEVRRTRLPRMADYARWGCAAAIALGHTEEEFWRAWDGNVQTQTNEALDASPVAQAAMHLMRDRATWEGAPAELLKELSAMAEELKIDTGGKAWPKEASWVYRRLMLVEPNLAQVGIRFSRARSGVTRNIRLSTQIHLPGEDPCVCLPQDRAEPVEDKCPDCGGKREEDL